MGGIRGRSSISTRSPVSEAKKLDGVILLVDTFAAALNENNQQYETANPRDEADQSDITHNFFSFQ